MKIFVEYIWIDGAKPTAMVRSKTRVIELTSDSLTLEQIPDWGFDGSSTNQAEGHSSDCILKPVRFVADPIRGGANILALCEVYDIKGDVHPSNTRAILRNILDAGASKQDAIFGFEQEYTLFSRDDYPLGWPENGYPGPQGPYYCGIGTARTAGRELVEAHAQACLDADLLLFGTNAEVMLGQWEFQIGYRGFKEDIDALMITDHHWIALWLLYRLAEEFDVKISRENKPMKGDWNGAGCHTNFSTKAMRDAATGKKEIEDILKRLEAKHDAHIAVYGDKLAERLTGDHETCAMAEFRYGESDRGASIRIPVTTAKDGYGYLEDRRPGANIDPYMVAARLLVTIGNMDEALLEKQSNKELVNAMSK
ncbi:glutamine synthetase [bacterium]|nr:glutamine synthetase [bacterium]